MNRKRDTKMSWGSKERMYSKKNTKTKEEGERDSKTYTKTGDNKLYTKMSITKQKAKDLGIKQEIERKLFVI